MLAQSAPKMRSKNGAHRDLELEYEAQICFHNISRDDLSIPQVFGRIGAPRSDPADYLFLAFVMENTARSLPPSCPHLAP